MGDARYMAYPSKTDAAQARETVASIAGDSPARVETRKPETNRLKRLASAVGFSLAAVGAVTSVDAVTSPANAGGDWRQEAQEHQNDTLQNTAQSVEQGASDIADKAGNALNEVFGNGETQNQAAEQDQPDPERDTRSGVDLAQDFVDPKTVYTTSALNVRDAPSTDGDRVATLDAGEGIRITGQVAGKPDGYVWYEIDDGAAYAADVGTLTPNAPGATTEVRRFAELDVTSKVAHEAKTLGGKAEKALDDVSDFEVQIGANLKDGIKAFGRALGIGDNVKQADFETARGTVTVAWNPDTHELAGGGNTLKVVREDDPHNRPDNNPTLGDDGDYGYAVVRLNGQTRYAVDGQVLDKEAAIDAHPQAQRDNTADLNPFN